jgi:hypothetical protein
MTAKQYVLLGYLANNSITAAVLADYPSLLDKENPDPEQVGEILAVVPVGGRGDCYRVRTDMDSRYSGTAQVLYTLSEIRSRYVALPT